MISTPICGTATLISISLSFSCPSRNFLRNTWRVLEFSSFCSACPHASRGGGSSASNTRSSANSSARNFTFSIAC
ncbi:Uncharacterised protein [Vibrio cholerae]|nr:Uncharacterised protein [Vibrio cholerae]